jgi:hypothetical protein
MPASAGHPRTLLLLLATSAWLAVLYGIRFGLLESTPEADPCLAAPAGLPCRGRALFWLASYREVFGITALALAALVWVLPARWRLPLAIAALFVALSALVFYNARFGAPAAVLGLLALADAGLLRPATDPSS